MSLHTNHIDANRESVYILADSSSPNRGLPKPMPFSWTGACYADPSMTDDYSTVVTFGPNPYSGIDYYQGSVLPSSVVGGGATGPCFNLAIDGDHTSAAAQVVTGRWYYQGWHARRDASNIYAEYYYDLPDLTKVLTLTEASPNYFTSAGANHSLNIGDNAWPSTATNEGWQGYLQGFKFWQAYLSPFELALEAMSMWPVLPKYAGVLWDVVPLRTKYDRRGMVKEINRRRWTFPNVEPDTGSFSALQTNKPNWYLGGALVVKKAASTGSVGAAAGTSTVSGIGSAVTVGVAASAGTSTVTGIGSDVTVTVGTATGTSTVTGVGSRLAISVGASAGSSTATATGSSLGIGVGSSAGSSTVTGQLSPIMVGSAAGTSTATSTGSSVTVTVGSSVGTSTVTGVGSATSIGVGSSAGVATVTGFAVSNVPVGSASGTSTVAGIGSSVNVGLGASSGTSSASAIGSSLAGGLGSATSSSTAIGWGSSVTTSAGVASGTSTVAATGSMTSIGAGSAAGSSTALGKAAPSIGLAAGSSNALAVGSALVLASGQAQGLATALAVGSKVFIGVGLAAGSSTALAVSGHKFGYARTREGGTKMMSTDKITTLMGMINE